MSSMGRIISNILILCLYQSIESMNKTVLRINTINEKQNQFLINKSQEFEVDFWTYPNSDYRPVIVCVDLSVINKFTDELKINKIHYSFDKHMNDLIDVNTRALPKSRAKKVFDYFYDYNDFNEITDQLNSLQNNYSKVLNVISLGKTFENRDIPAVIISKNKTIENKIVVFECGIHAREWISVSFCLWSINKLLKDKRLLNHYQFLIVPVLNPDGYVYTWDEHRLWRKNRQISIFNDTCVGTDLNRNWETKYFCKYKSSPDPCGGNIACGDKPFSAPETKAFSDYLITKKDKIFAYFSFHSFSQLIYYPQGYSTKLVPNKHNLQTLSKIGIKALKRKYGTEYDSGPTSELMGVISGISIDWIYDTLNVKNVFMFELRDKGYYMFLLPENLINPTCEETWDGVEAILKHLTQKPKLGSKSLNPNPNERSVKSGQQIHTNPYIYYFILISIFIKKFSFV